MKIVLIVVAALFSVLALAGISSQQPGPSIENSNVTGTTKLPDLLSMGPDPGGHTGATVTPETSKTGQAAVDSARQSSSGGKTENSGPPVNTSQQSKKQSGDKQY